ncbi:glutamate--tRNA ligase [Candidatus Zinderia endosymbiont of Aphrophora alni]|uniref:glutamate--tRNA ligase n=1 Tax=Candidatus Zinderia endosymbiont of Aphrophora alni TaxID=3077951 RepID=UPI0030D62F19
MNKKNIINNNIIRTRFAPSPTGFLHLGGARTALFSWAYAKKFNGLFFLRIENTDIKRSTSKAEKNIIDSIKWLGLKYDKNIIYQTNRFKRYNEIIKKMLKKGTAYFCYSTKEELKKNKEKQKKIGIKPKYNEKWRPQKGKILPKIPKNINPVIRFKNPKKNFVFWKDLVKGKKKISNNELDDLIIVRSNGIPTYNFCAILDDLDMKITHVIRGDDHINNTPRQINIAKALNKTPPKYAHIPMILDKNGEKLSKRNKAININEYYKMGFLPEAIINYIARLGWSHKNEEIFSINKFYKWFNFKQISKSPSKFDKKKLIWINKYYINSMNNNKLFILINKYLKKNIYIKNTIKIKKIIKLFKSRSKTIKNLINYIKIFFKEIKINKKKISIYNTDIIKLALKKFIKFCLKINWNKKNIDKIITFIINKYKLNLNLFATTLRILILNKTKTPSISSILEIFDKKIIINKIIIFLKNY